jgi:hypothetical protein
VPGSIMQRSASECRCYLSWLALNKDFVAVSRTTNDSGACPVPDDARQPAR